MPAASRIARKKATVDKIAFEKAGILKRGAPAIVAAQEPEALRVIEGAAMRVQAPLTLAERDFFIRAEHGRLVFEDRQGLLDLPTPRLAGRHQFANAANAVATLRAIAPDLPSNAFERGLLGAEWPARLQRLRSGPLVDRAPPQAEVWLDGAHNEAGGRVLAEAMADFEEAASRPLALICGTLTTKDTAGFLAHFKGLAREAIAVPIEGEHVARSAEEVAVIARQAGLNAKPAASVGAALDALAERVWEKPPRILITGSLYLAGSVLEANGNLPR